MNRREMLERMTVLGAGMVASPFHLAARAAPDPHQRLLAQAEAVPDQKEKVKRFESLGYVVVSPEGPRDGGHFGKNTPGTATTGLQEAFDYAKEIKADVYICGGGSYRLDETLHIPWRHTFRCESGESWIWYTPPHGDAVWIDSMMCGRIRLPEIGTSADGAVVRIDPSTVGPDGFACIGGVVLEIGSLIGSGSVIDELTAEEQKGIGLWMDASGGPIHALHILIREINACNTGIYMSGTHMVSHNRITVYSFRHNTGVQIGDSETPSANYHENCIDGWLGHTSAGGVGVRIFGQRNILNLAIERGTPGTEERGTPGTDIVFEAEARDNLIIAQRPPNGIVNRATHPTNRIISVCPIGFDIPTPPVPASGQDVVNREPYLVDVIIREPGAVSEWVLTDPNGKAETVTAGLSAGQRFVLDPGDRIRFTYSAAPSWRWKALG